MWSQKKLIEDSDMWFDVNGEQAVFFLNIRLCNPSLVS